jgi:alanyl-tRNA synthetase
LSRQGAGQKFAGGLADHSGRVVKMHTATHLLHQALRDVLGEHVQQKGSNITDERLRFDFTHSQKVTPEQLKQVEATVNAKIMAAIPVEKRILKLDEARALGATGLFGEKYGETVSVYLVGEYSKEFCGGPHVTNTSEIGQFKILKEEASSAGIRRIKATVE